MAGERAQAVQARLLNRRLCHLLVAAAVVSGFQQTAANAATRTAVPGLDPSPGGDRNGVLVAPNLGGYYPWARRPGTNSGHRKAPTATQPATHATAASAPQCESTPTFLGGAPVECVTGVVSSTTPQQLARQSWGSLRLPLPDVRTAPPRGRFGLVGLPEWVWVPREHWRPIVRRASAGGTWAQVTAKPEETTVVPGDGLAPVHCGGPGTAYDPRLAASAQHTDCSYAYRRSSRQEPAQAYRVTVTVTWTGTWTGSGGAGGRLPDISRSTTFGLRVAEAQGLYG